MRINNSLTFINNATFPGKLNDSLFFLNTCLNKMLLLPLWTAGLILLMGLQLVAACIKCRFHSSSM